MSNLLLENISLKQKLQQFEEKNEKLLNLAENSVENFEYEFKYFKKNAQLKRKQKFLEIENESLKKIIKILKTKKNDKKRNEMHVFMYDNKLLYLLYLLLIVFILFFMVLIFMFNKFK